jgi:hypothetical protein
MNNTFTWSPDELYHHGIKGQKWGIRRYQNPDGTLTPAGKRRYGAYYNDEPVKPRKLKRDFNKAESWWATNQVRGVDALGKATASNAQARSQGIDFKTDEGKKNKLYSKTVGFLDEMADAGASNRQIEDLEKRIVDKVVSSGYTLNSKPVTRGRWVGQMYFDNNFGLYYVRGEKPVEINGTRVTKVSKKGDQSVNMYSYDTHSYYDYKKNPEKARRQ